MLRPTALVIDVDHAPTKVNTIKAKGLSLLASLRIFFIVCVSSSVRISKSLSPIMLP